MLPAIQSQASAFLLLKAGFLGPRESKPGFWAPVSQGQVSRFQGSTPPPQITPSLLPQTVTQKAKVELTCV